MKYVVVNPSCLHLRYNPVSPKRNGCALVVLAMTGYEWERAILYTGCGRAIIA
jgi:hypothetical protein